MSRGKTIIVIVTSGTAILMSAIIIAISFIFVPLVITGHSMDPTIMHGDRILVSKLTYKFREPRRGDVISFKIGWKRLVKRIVGVPGDVIEVRNGLIYRNGKAAVHDPSMILHSRNLSRRSYGPRMVQDRHVFVMGDNRFLSMDSRDFGMIPYQDITGKAVLVYFPPRWIGELR